MVKVIRLMLHSYNSEILEKAIEKVKSLCNCEPKLTRSKLIPNYVLIELPISTSTSSLSNALRELGLDDFKIVVIE